MRLALGIALVLTLASCRSMQHAAQQDPMKCERDPKCESKRGREQDCSMQCSDDPACVDRCESMQTTKLGH